MNLPYRILFPILIALAGTAQAQSASDFRLPPNPTPTTNPDVQGPVDPDAPVPVRPRAIPTAQPTPTATPRPVPTSAPTSAPTTAAPTPSPTQRAAPQPQPRATARPPVVQQPAPGEVAPDPAPATPQAGAQPSPQAPAFNPGAVAPPTATTSAQPVDERPWALWAAILAALAAAVAALVWWQRRRAAAAPPPEIVPFEAVAALSDRQAQARIDFAVDRMSRSMRTAMLTYRLTVANRSDVAIRDLVVECDMVSARNSVPLAQQLATQETALALREEVGRIGPHQTRHVTGQLNLALGEVEPVVRGQTMFFVPLARFRISAANLDTGHYTHVVGQLAQDGSGKLQPFPLADAPGGIERVSARPVT